MDFPQRLRQLRTARGMTQDQLAAAAGIATDTISLYERGRSRPRGRTVTALAAALDCDGAYLMGTPPAIDGGGEILDAAESELVSMFRAVGDDSARRELLAYVRGFIAFRGRSKAGGLLQDLDDAARGRPRRAGEPRPRRGGSQAG